VVRAERTRNARAVLRVEDDEVCEPDAVRAVGTVDDDRRAIPVLAIRQGRDDVLAGRDDDAVITNANHALGLERLALDLNSVDELPDSIAARILEQAHDLRRLRVRVRRRERVWDERRVRVARDVQRRGRRRDQEGKQGEKGAAAAGEPAKNREHRRE
jgi:hypothetical protein